MTTLWNLFCLCELRFHLEKKVPRWNPEFHFGDFSIFGIPCQEVANPGSVQQKFLIGNSEGCFKQAMYFFASNQEAARARPIFMWGLLQTSGLWNHRRHELDALIFFFYRKSWMPKTPQCKDEYHPTSALFEFCFGRILGKDLFFIENICRKRSTSGKLEKTWKNVRRWETTFWFGAGFHRPI